MSLDWSCSSGNLVNSKCILRDYIALSANEVYRREIQSEFYHNFKVLRKTSLLFTYCIVPTIVLQGKFLTLAGSTITLLVVCQKLSG